MPKPMTGPPHPNNYINLLRADETIPCPKCQKLNRIIIMQQPPHRIESFSVTQEVEERIRAIINTAKPICKKCGGVYETTVEGIRVMKVLNGRGGYKLQANCPNCPPKGYMPAFVKTVDGKRPTDQQMKALVEVCQEPKLDAGEFDPKTLFTKCPKCRYIFENIAANNSTDRISQLESECKDTLKEYNDLAHELLKLGGENKQQAEQIAEMPLQVVQDYIRVNQGKAVEGVMTKMAFAGKYGINIITFEKLAYALTSPLEQQIAKIQSAFAPVAEWYGGGTEGNRSIEGIVKDAVRDLQSDRKELLEANKQIVELKAMIEKTLKISELEAKG